MASLLERLGSAPKLTREEEHELAVRAKAGDRKAVDRLVEANLRYVGQIASIFGRNRAHHIDDLVSAGTMGLYKAVLKFDPDHGTRLLTYAVWWIRVFILNCIREEPIVHRPISKDKKRRKPKTRDVSLSDEEGIAFMRSISTSDTSPETQLIEADERRECAVRTEILLRGLCEREMCIIRERLMAESPKTHEELGKLLGGVTRQRVQQLEVELLAKLRAKMPRVLVDRNRAMKVRFRASKARPSEAASSTTSLRTGRAAA